MTVSFIINIFFRIFFKYIYISAYIYNIVMDLGRFAYRGSNYNRLFNNKKFIQTLITIIRKRLGRNLLRTEKSYIITYLRETPVEVFKGRKYDEIVMVLSTAITQKLLENTSCHDDQEINIHELLKNEIGVSTDKEFDTFNIGDIDTKFTDEIVSNFTNQVDVTSFMGSNNIIDLQKLFNPELVKKKAYITLDTRYRRLENDGTTEFVWNFSNNEIIVQGSVNAIGNIENITAMRIYPVRIPYNSQADNEYNRVSLYISELSAQSFLNHENSRYHFLFNLVVRDRWIELCPENFNDGYFYFRNPITRLETLTVSFGAPLSTINFDPDRLSFQVISYGTTTQFQSTSSHNIETGDLVYISNFTTFNSGANNSIIGSVNSENGHIINYIDETTFEINVDTSSIFPQLETGTITITSGSATINGTGTNFQTAELRSGDRLFINGFSYIIQSIASNTQLTLTEPVNEPNASGLTYFKDNRVPVNTSVYFGSKRIFISIELEYLSSTE
jgi:hypothetical protein